MEEVIRRAQGGDTDALGLLWRGHQHLLLRYFRGKGMSDPEDLASTVWIDVASSLHRFHGSESDFRSWLFTIASRRRVDEIRRAGRRSDHERAARPHPDVLQSPSAADDAERAGGLDRALAMVRSLPADQAEAVLLRVVGDLSMAQVGEIMGRREGSVRVLVHRGLRRLAQQHGVPSGADVTKTSDRTMSAP